MKYLLNNYLSAIFITFSLIFYCGLNAYSQIPDKPYPPKLVNDYSGLLNNDEVQLLEAKLSDFSDSTSTQIVVVIINDIGEYDASDFAFQIGEKWGVGQKGKDNGIVLLVKPSGGQSERKIAIAVGYGLEAIIPDAVSRRIIDNEIIPLFRQSKYYDGINKGISILMSLANKEFSAEEYVKKTNKGFSSGMFVILVIIVVFILSSVFRVRRYSGTNHVPFWLALMMMSNTGRGSFNNFGSGSGGFGGFGGGSFGGGGASGSW